MTNRVSFFDATVLGTVSSVDTRSDGSLLATVFFLSRSGGQRSVKVKLPDTAGVAASDSLWATGEIDEGVIDAMAERSWRLFAAEHEAEHDEQTSYRHEQPHETDDEELPPEGNPEEPSHQDETTQFLTPEPDHLPAKMPPVVATATPSLALTRAGAIPGRPSFGKMPGMAARTTPATPRPSGSAQALPAVQPPSKPVTVATQPVPQHPAPPAGLAPAGQLGIPSRGQSFGRPSGFGRPIVKPAQTSPTAIKPSGPSVAIGGRGRMMGASEGDDDAPADAPMPAAPSRQAVQPNANTQQAVERRSSGERTPNAVADEIDMKIPW